jgi:hypothetical protein
MSENRPNDENENFWDRLKNTKLKKIILITSILVTGYGIGKSNIELRILDYYRHYFHETPIPNRNNIIPCSVEIKNAIIDGQSLICKGRAERNNNLLKTCTKHLNNCRDVNIQLEKVNR